MKLEREFYIPRESAGQTNIATITDADAVIYTYTANGRPCARAFHGKAAKPDWSYAFNSEDHRTRKIAEYIDGRKERAKMMAELKANRSRPHSLKVGDILVSSWGYDQTNIDYYQVTRVVSPISVEICKIGRESGPEEGFMTAYCMPMKDKFIGKPMIKRANSTNSVNITGYASASPWDGKRDRYSWYA